MRFKLVLKDTKVLGEQRREVQFIQLVNIFSQQCSVKPGRRVLNSTSVTHSCVTLDKSFKLSQLPFPASERGIKNFTGVNQRIQHQICGLLIHIITERIQQQKYEKRKEPVKLLSAIKMQVTHIISSPVMFSLWFDISNLLPCCIWYNKCVNNFKTILKKGSLEVSRQISFLTENFYNLIPGK